MNDSTNEAEELLARLASEGCVEVIFRLKDDAIELSKMQESSLHHENSGLKAIHGLIGTEEWWAAIECGTLPLHTARGIVRGLWLDQYNYGPASFEMELADGSFFSGSCPDRDDTGKAVKNFRLGRICEVDYVLQSFDQTNRISESVPVWLEVRVGEVVPWKVEPLGSYLSS